MMAGRIAGRLAALAATSLLGLAACEAIVEDFEISPCQPDPPQSCADLGDEAAQARGCCDRAAATVWYCEDGVLEHDDCGAGTCDYDIAIQGMACVD